MIDIAYRYDGWADFPEYPLNLVATANALLGIALLHGTADKNINAETLAEDEVSIHGNTTYYLLDSEHVPLLMPFEGPGWCRFPTNGRIRAPRPGTGRPARPRTGARHLERVSSE